MLTKTSILRLPVRGHHLIREHIHDEFGRRSPPALSPLVGARRHSNLSTDCSKVLIPTQLSSRKT